jgi:hypothetical protein
MEPVFTILYTEMRSMEILEERIKARWKSKLKLLSKDEKLSLLTTKDICSIHVPVSRQQKGFDFIAFREAYSSCERLIKTVQVKGSRAYYAEGKGSDRFKYTLSFNRFEIPESSDLFMFIGLFPDYNHGVRVDKAEWKPVVLMFTYTELKSFFSTLKTKKGTDETRFYVSFDGPDNLTLTRGSQNKDGESLNNYLLTDQRIDDIFF